MRHARRIVRLAAALLALSVPALTLAGTFEQQLANGLRVIVKEDRRAPTAVLMVWYGVGSMDETSGTTGVAHLLEHMMFKGTPRIGAGQFSALVAAAGGSDNAFTSRDYTAYFEQVPKHKLGQMLQLEADRMRHLNLDPAEFAQEIKVVMEERRLRTDDQPQALLVEQMGAVALQAHPYRVPVVGWMSDLESMSAGDAREFYERWYVPNNAFVVVVGDVDHDDVLALVVEHFGGLARRPLPLRKPQQEPAQNGIRRLTLRAPAQSPVVLMAYKVPVIRDVESDVDPYALEILAAILDGHEAARLTKNLVRNRRLAVAAGASYESTARGPGFFFLQGSPSRGRSSAEVEAGLRAEVARIAAHGVGDQELARARAQRVAGEIFKLDSMFEQAMDIGQLEAVGIPHRHGARMIEKLQAVTAQQVRAVAGKYFGDAQLTVVDLDPQAPRKSPKSPERPLATDQRGLR